MSYAIDLNSNSGYGVIYLENNENDQQLDGKIKLSVYDGFIYPDSLNEGDTVLGPHRSICHLLKK